MTRKKISERSDGECIMTTVLVGAFYIILNLVFPLPTGITPALVGFGIVLFCTFIYIAVRKKPSGSSGPSNTGSQTSNPPIIKSQILCTNCNSPVGSDQEYCNQCGHLLK